MTHLKDDETELMGQIANLDYEASLEDPVLHALSRKGLVLITSGKRVIITEAAIDWLDDNGWACGDLSICDLVDQCIRSKTAKDGLTPMPGKLPER